MEDERRRKNGSQAKTPLKTKENKKANLPKKSILLVAFITVLILAIIFAAAKIFSPSSSFSGEKNQTDENFINGTVSDKAGFPLSFPSGIDNVSTSKSTIYISSRNTVTCYDYSGRRNRELTFNYVSPMIKTNNNYAVVYDTKGSNFALLYKDKIIFEGKNEDGGYINSASVSKNGNFLLASRSSKTSGKLTYYNKNGESFINLSFANEYLVNCDISDNGENIICSGIGATSGEIYTRVYFFSGVDIIEKKKENQEEKQIDNKKEYVIKGAFSIDSFFDGNKKVIAVCQDRRALIDFSKEEPAAQVQEYSSTILKQASDSLGNTAIVQKKEGSFDKTYLSVYDSHNKLVHENDLPSGIKDICLHSSKTFVLTDDAIYKADKKVTKLIDLSSVNNSIVSGNRKIYYYTSGVLNRLD